MTGYEAVIDSPGSSKWGAVLAYYGKFRGAKKCPFDFSRRNSDFLEAFDVISVSELNDVFITLPT